MIKGILALFRSGLIFNPMVLIGVSLGFVSMARLDAVMLKALYTNYSLYALMFMVALGYVYFFKCVYVEGGYEIDWKETLLSAFGHFLMLVISFIFSMLFVMVVSFSSDSEEPKPSSDVEKLTQELKQQEKELLENYDAIMNAYEMSNQ